MRFQFRDLTGIRSGRLVVIKPDHQDKHRHWHWLCKCDCGKTKIIDGCSIVKGATRSCGCLSNEQRKTGNNRRTHGKYNTRIYRVWKGMIQRCYGKNIQNCNWYSNRGIIICDEWRNDFKAFYDWSMSHGYTDELTIDRIDNNGNYCPENCRWVTCKEQQNNRRNTRKITCDGVTHSISEWAEILKVNRSAIHGRVHRKWDEERIIKQPIKTTRKK